MEINEIRYFSMFTGVGGFELGINNYQQSEDNEKQSTTINQYQCVGFSETDKYAAELLKQKFPSIKNWGDCTKINPDELPDFDMLCGGFPCQAFSIAGKRRGFKDTRGTMFFQIARILEIKRPKIILLENVKGLLNHEKGKTFRVILQTLDELGYETQWMVLNSKFFGVPQNRERVFIIGSIRGESRPEILPFEESSKEIISQSEISNTLISSYHKIARGTTMIQIEETKGNSQGNRVYSTEGTSTSIASQAGGQGAKTGLYAMRGRNPENPSDRISGNPTEQRLELNKEGITNTLTSVQKDNLWVENMKIRRLTPTECERLQGFPDNWTKGFSDTQRYKMMGNAVTVNVVKAIIKKWN